MNRQSKYWYWFGVNPVAVAVSVLGAILYVTVAQPDHVRRPLLLQVHDGEPADPSWLSAVLYYVLSRLLVIPFGKGGYDSATRRAEPAPSVSSSGRADSDSVHPLRVQQGAPRMPGYVKTPEECDRIENMLTEMAFHVR